MNRMIKQPSEIEAIARGGKILAKILSDIAAMVKPGISTEALNDFAESQIIKAGGRPSFAGYGDKKNPFPSGLCTSINDAVVHGIPSSEDVLQEGDIVGLDIGMEYEGFYTDTAVTVGVGKISTEAQKLMLATKEALAASIAAAKPGKRIGDIGHASESVAKKHGFGVVYDLVGHGVGYEVHEDPAVPGYGKPGTGLELKEGMVLAIEPMLCQNKPHIFFDTDGWTVRTHDGGLASHFEHTIVVTKNGAQILTQH